MGAVQRALPSKLLWLVGGVGQGRAGLCGFIDECFCDAAAF